MSDPPKRLGLSLYADLLGGDKQGGGATISSAPVKYDLKKAEEDEARKKKDASLKFQPIRRPQVQKTNRPKPPSSSTLHKSSSSTANASAGSNATSTNASQPQPMLPRSNFEDWVGEEDEHYYQERPRQDRGGKKNKRKKKQEEVRTWDWDDIYDPTMPNNHADYKGSDEQFREIRDWKARLYYHQMKEAKKAEREGSVQSQEEGKRTARPFNKMFAPPSNLNFAPPAMDSDARPTEAMDEDDDYYPPDNDARDRTDDPMPSFAPQSVPDDATGDDAYMRRIRMSGHTSDAASPAPAFSTAPTPPAAVAPVSRVPPPAVVEEAPNLGIEAKRAEAQAKIAAFKAKLQKPTLTSVSVSASGNATSASPTPPINAPPPPPPAEIAGQISRAPVRYDVPAPDSHAHHSTDDLPSSSASPSNPTDQPRSNRPGQKGFAERLMKKYGWEKGLGLGASNEGITTALVGKAEKRKKLPDASGGGWAAPKNMGKIVGGKKRQKTDHDGADAASSSSAGPNGDAAGLSTVARMENMLTGLDVEREIEDGNLLQEIGEEMGREYGTVERVFVWRRDTQGGDDAVFVKFVSELGALRAVQGMEGAEFAGNVVKAGFFDAGRWERGELGGEG